jgi:hypothetical protein
MDSFEYELCRCRQQELIEHAQRGLAAAAGRRERRAARRLAKLARVLSLRPRPTAVTAPLEGDEAA